MVSVVGILIPSSQLRARALQSGTVGPKKSVQIRVRAPTSARSATCKFSKRSICQFWSLPLPIHSHKRSGCAKSKVEINSRSQKKIGQKIYFFLGEKWIWKFWFSKKSRKNRTFFEIFEILKFSKKIEKIQLFWLFLKIENSWFLRSFFGSIPDTPD